MDLKNYDNTGFNRGRSVLIEALWVALSALFVSSWLPGARHRVFLLRLFGAKIGVGVTIKPGVKVKFPWKLTIGDYSWIGENAWIDNLDYVNIGSNVVLSQAVYLCTGSHDWKSSAFDLITKPISLHDEVWLCARSTVGPGVNIEKGAVLTLAAVAVKDLDSWSVYAGSPAMKVKNREQVV